MTCCFFEGISIGKDTRVVPDSNHLALKLIEFFLGGRVIILKYLCEIMLPLRENGKSCLVTRMLKCIHEDKPKTQVYSQSNYCELWIENQFTRSSINICQRNRVLFWFKYFSLFTRVKEFCLSISWWLATRLNSICIFQLEASIILHVCSCVAHAKTQELH